jgi:tRNA-2-methylthio-N6-dimethylallyladenosine synthase
MPYIHLPIQSGDEDILAKMNRKMNIQDYIDLIKYIKKNVPNVAISTDIIVGFPNESKKQFENTLKLFKKIKYDNAYTFIYSKRTGTPAANLIDTIMIDEKEERLAKLNEIVRKFGQLNAKK